MNPYHQKSMSEAESHTLQRSQIMNTSTVESPNLTSPTLSSPRPLQMSENNNSFHPPGRLRITSLENNESVFKSAASKLLSPLPGDKFF